MRGDDPGAVRRRGRRARSRSGVLRAGHRVRPDVAAEVGVAVPQRVEDVGLDRADVGDGGVPGRSAGLCRPRRRWPPAGRRRRPGRRRRGTGGVERSPAPRPAATRAWLLVRSRRCTVQPPAVSARPMAGPDEPGADDHDRGPVLPGHEVGWSGPGAPGPASPVGSSVSGSGSRRQLRRPSRPGRRLLGAPRAAASASRAPCEPAELPRQRAVAVEDRHLERLGARARAAGAFGPPSERERADRQPDGGGQAQVGPEARAGRSRRSPRPSRPSRRSPVSSATEPS